jgi:hypothetical protein
MPPMIRLDEKLASIRSLVFGFGGRLVERQLFRFLFEDTDPEPLLAALGAYCNADGGFGNGIEPDLMTPQSSAIGLETALHYFQIVEGVPALSATAIAAWLDRNVDDRGIIPHPPDDADRYPIQPWWKNADDDRVFAICGVLRHLGVTIPERVVASVSAHAMKASLPDALEEYHYPIYVYSMYCPEFSRRVEFLDDFRNRFPELCRRLPSRFLVLSRYWSPMAALVDREFIEAEANRMWDAIDASGRIPTGYPDLPWWDPIMLLDALAFLVQQHLLIH